MVRQQAGVLEVEIIEHRVLDARGGDFADERLLPDALGHPRAAHLATQATLEPSGVGANLADPVASRDHRQNGFIECAADDLNASGGRVFGEPVEVFGVPYGEPFHEAAARVERELQRARVVGEDVEKRLVAFLVRLLDDRVEISHRLMIVQDKRETDGTRHGELSERGKAGIGDDGGRRRAGAVDGGLFRELCCKTCAASGRTLVRCEPIGRSGAALLPCLFLIIGSFCRRHATRRRRIPKLAPSALPATEPTP